jgi:hypothetical protein
MHHPATSSHTVDTPSVDAWRAWSPEQAAAALAGIGAPWCVAGGWALDLWRGQQTRPHEDLEIAILRPQFELFRTHLRGLERGLECFAAGSGEVTALPAAADPPLDKHQVWLLERPAGVWRLDMFLEPGDIETWVCRRDETIRRPRAEMTGVSASGVPYLRPEGVLLYKAKAVRPKDEADFAVCAPLMDAAARRWLQAALQRVHPGHPWIGALD